MEAFIGEWEGKAFEEILARRADAPPGPEPGADLASRARRRGARARSEPACGAAIEGILARHPEGNVVVVCHGGVINAYVAPLLGVDHEMFFIPENTSLNSVVVEGDRRRVRFLNDHLHLTDPHLFGPD